MIRGAWILLLIAPVASAQTTDAAANAEALNRLAVEAYQARDFEDAVAQWRAAQRIYPTWKYALNLAGTLAELQRWQEAWAAGEEAEGLAIPREHAGPLLTIKQEIERRLFPTHGRLELTVLPEDAIVMIDDQRWGRRRSRWVTGARSTLRVERAGYKSQKLVWEHEVGAVSRKTVSLERLDMRGTLLIEGTPKDAVVKVAGKSVGTLPMAPRLAKPGIYEVTIEKKGYAPYKAELTVRVGKTTRLNVSLRPLQTLKTSAGTSPIAIAGWSSLGGGVALLGAGAGLLVAAQSAADEARALNEDPSTGPSDYADYTSRLGELEDDHSTYQTAGAVLLGVGAAAAVTGATLLVWDLLDDGPSTTTLGPLPVPGGGGLAATVLF